MNFFNKESKSKRYFFGGGGGGEGAKGGEGGGGAWGEGELEQVNFCNKESKS